VTRVAAQSLVSSYSWQPKMSPVRLPPLVGLTCHHPNTELTISTNQENNGKTRKKKANNNSDITQQEFSVKIGPHTKSAKSRRYSQVSNLIVYYRVKRE